ncbi:MAG: ferritin-like domain-containing protein [Caldilineaceae bacterium]
MMNTNEPIRMNRRNFLRASAATLVVGTLAASSLGTGHAYAQSGNATIDVLNYALTLEHLESRAYSEVLAAGLVSGRARDYFQAFGAHEAAHVDALTQTIRSMGGTPVMAQQNYNWPDFQSQEEVITYFQVVEELGAAAYLGQAPKLVGGGDLLTAAVSIHNVEAQHAAALADLIGISPSPAFAQPKTMAEVLAVVGPILEQGEMPTQMPSTGLGGYMQSSGIRFSR